MDTPHDPIKIDHQARQHVTVKRLGSEVAETLSEQPSSRQHALDVASNDTDTGIANDTSISISIGIANEV